MQVREFDLRSLDKMLPCPFCGGEAELDTHQAYAQIANGKIGHRVVVYCADCGADQGTCVEDVPDIHPNEVIERWNKRHAAANKDTPMTQEQLEKILPYIVARFLSWKLPADFSPDAGISFNPIYNAGTPYEARHEPSGTNLLNADQAFEMFRHVLSHPAVTELAEGHTP
jgi:hypothetical protein